MEEDFAREFVGRKRVVVVAPGGRARVVDFQIQGISSVRATKQETVGDMVACSRSDAGVEGAVRVEQVPKASEDGIETDDAEFAAKQTFAVSDGFSEVDGGSAGIDG